LSNVKVSVIIPAYNVQKYIDRSIKSAVNQTLKDIEIIVVNDGSTDNTRDIIEKLAKEDNRIVVINKENGGLSSARNAGIKVAKGEYIQHLDGDDWIEKDACETMYNFAKNNKVDIVVSDYYIDNDRGNIKYKPMRFPKNKNICDPKEYLHLVLPLYEAQYIWNKLIKRELYINNDIWHPENISLGEDLATTPRLIIMANKIGKIDKAYVHYIVNPVSLTRDQVSKKIYMLYDAQMIVDDFFKKHNQYEEFKDDLSDYLFFSMSFMFTRKAFPGDSEYEKSFNRALEYFASRPKEPRYKKFRLWKRLLTRFIGKYPSRRNFSILIAIMSRASMVKKFILRENY